MDDPQAYLAQKYLKATANSKNISNCLTGNSHQGQLKKQSSGNNSFDEDLNQYIYQIKEKIQEKLEKELSNSNPQHSQEDLIILTQQQCNELKINRGAGVSLSRSEYDYLSSKLDLQNEGSKKRTNYQSQKSIQKVKLLKTNSNLMNQQNSQ